MEVDEGSRDGLPSPVLPGSGDLGSLTLSASQPFGSLSHLANQFSIKASCRRFR